MAALLKATTGSQGNLAHVFLTLDPLYPEIFVTSPIVAEVINWSSPRSSKLSRVTVPGSFFRVAVYLHKYTEIYEVGTHNFEYLNLR